MLLDEPGLAKSLQRGGSMCVCSRRMRVNWRGKSRGIEPRSYLDPSVCTRNLQRAAQHPPMLLLRGQTTTAVSSDGGSSWGEPRTQLELNIPTLSYFYLTIWQIRTQHLLSATAYSEFWGHTNDNTETLPLWHLHFFLINLAVLA